MKITLKIWRQAGPDEKGKLVTYKMDDVDEEMSFLEMLDVLNQRLILKNERPVVFEHDCREGICGCCGFMINGIPHGPLKLTTVCQLHMRHFKDGETLILEPFRSRAFPVLKDLMVDRAALDKIVQAGGFISARIGSAPDANTFPISKIDSERSMDAAACIGCGACVAACPNGSAMLFVAAKVSHLGLLPQGQPERRQRALRMVAKMDELGFGACSNHAECEAVCPKGVSIDFIARLNRDYMVAGATTKMEKVKKV